MATSPAGPEAQRSDDSRRTTAARRRTALLAAALASALTAVAVRSPALDQKPAEKPASKAAPAAPHAGAPAEDEPAEKVWKNIKVLQGIPSSQKGPIMHVMRAALGVRCDYCHVIEGDRYDLDTKPQKDASRQMIRMVLEINKTHFAGTDAVTCQTCHHGQPHPSRVAAIELGLITIKPPPPEIKLPTATQVLDRYIEALGGRAALEAVRSRVSRGTLAHLQILNPGTDHVIGVNRGQNDPLEIVQRVPDDNVVTFGPPDGKTVQLFHGDSVTIRTPQGEHVMTRQEVRRLIGRYDLRRDLELRDKAAASQVVGKDRIDGREVYLLSTTAPDGSPAILSFDVETGLLRRQAVHRATLVGPDPEQIDFEDYRDAGGVKVPFLIKTSVLDDIHFGTTRKLAEVRNNAAP